MTTQALSERVTFRLQSFRLFGGVGLKPLGLFGLLLGELIIENIVSPLGGAQRGCRGLGNMSRAFSLAVEGRIVVVVVRPVLARTI